MTVYRVAEHRHIHSCPNFPDGRAWRTSRRVVEVVAGGPCLTPVTLPRTGAVVACARRLPERHRCANCLLSIEVVEVSLQVEPAEVIA